MEEIETVQFIYKVGDNIESKSFYHKITLDTTDNHDILNESDVLVKEHIKTHTESQILDSKELLCLDLHGVTDVLNQTIEIAKVPIFIISYVGRSSAMRKVAFDEIKTRIENGQAMFGALVYEKYDPTVQITPIMEIDPVTNISSIKEEILVLNSEDIELSKNKYISTKAWLMELTTEIYPDINIKFFDDSDCHINLTKFMFENNNRHNIKAYIVTQKTPEDIIAYINNPIS